MKKSWKNVELSKGSAESFKQFLKANGIRYEASGCYNLIHFEVLVDDRQTEMCDDFLERRSNND